MKLFNHDVQFKKKPFIKIRNTHNLLNKKIIYIKSKNKTKTTTTRAVNNNILENINTDTRTHTNLQPFFQFFPQTFSLECNKRIST